MENTGSVMFIAIDGYNFIKHSPGLRKLEQISLQKAREGLIDQLARYKRQKGHTIMVVFDGDQKESIMGNRDRSQGIEIVFSKRGEQADDVLKRLSGAKREGILIVTSDLAVARFAEKKGSMAIPVSDFAQKIDRAQPVPFKDTPQEIFQNQSVAPKKRGPSHRLSKSKRRVAAAAKKL